MCQLIVSAQEGAWRDRQSSKQNVQRPECNVCDAVHVIANQEWHGKKSDLAGRLIESTGHSRRIVESPEDTPQLLQKADGRSYAQEAQSENIQDGLSQRRRGSGNESWSKMLARIGNWSIRHRQYLKRQIVDIKRQEAEWMEDPKQSLPRSSPTVRAGAS